MQSISPVYRLLAQQRERLRNLSQEKAEGPGSFARVSSPEEAPRARPRGAHPPPRAGRRQEERQEPPPNAATTTQQQVSLRDSALKRGRVTAPGAEGTPPEVKAPVELSLCAQSA